MFGPLPQCPYVTGYRSSLNVHRKTHHDGTKDHQCPHCQLAFYTVATFNREGEFGCGYWKYPLPGSGCFLLIQFVMVYLLLLKCPTFDLQQLFLGHFVSIKLELN